LFEIQQLCATENIFPELFPLDFSLSVCYFQTAKNYQAVSEKEVKTLAHTITQECINCGACDDSCPVGAISEAGDKRVIGDDCIDCGACVDTCPVGAIQG
jgi:ferredoxin